MNHLDLALVAVAALTFVGFLRWLEIRYPQPKAQDDLTKERVRRLEERVSTIELQRGISRKVPER